MGQRWSLKTEEQIQDFLTYVRTRGNCVVEFVENQRTPTQNNALHQWFEDVAETLNSGGHDLRAILKPSVAIEWNPSLVKGYLWKPVQKAATGLESTSAANTKQYNEIYEVLCKHFAEKHGIVLPPWPQREL